MRKDYPAMVWLIGLLGKRGQWLRAMSPQISGFALGLGLLVTWMISTALTLILIVITSLALELWRWLYGAVERLSARLAELWITLTEWLVELKKKMKVVERKAKH